MTVKANGQRLGDGQRWQKPDVLEGASESKRRPTSRRRPRDICTVVCDPTIVRRREPRQHVESDSLSRAVRPNDPENFSPIDVQIERVDCSDRPKGLAKSANAKNDIFSMSVDGEGPV